MPRCTPSLRERRISDELDAGALQAVALAVAAERSLDAVLHCIVEGLARQRAVALARVWLLEPGDVCESCRLRAQCPDQSQCLHLFASAGTPFASPGEDWSRIDGYFRRFPLGVFKVGQVGATASALLLRDASSESWARPEWVQREGIQSFAGQPLIFRGETLGVLAVFRRAAISENELGWLRTFADFAAAAIANGRAFAEIERLRERIEEENAYLREEVHTALAFDSIVGDSDSLRRVLPKIELVAPTDAAVTILGESGTGKELVAREIHKRSRRAQRPLIKVNCSAIAHDMFESEFFGHVRGSFTGALRDRPGRFQLAHGGTIFLDEIGDLPLDLQPKLLRVLQEGEYEPVGADATRHVDVRVLAATNRDLQVEVRAGRFRADLYYRLSVFPIELPPLRERKEDIPSLVLHFVALAAKKFGVPEPRVMREQCAPLMRHDWPGNVRELQNVVERAVILSRNGPLRLDLTDPDRGTNDRHHEQSASAAAEEIVPETEWRRRERANVLAALRLAGGRIYGSGGAAALLQIKPSTLQSRLRTLGIRPRETE